MLRDSVVLEELLQFVKTATNSVQNGFARIICKTCARGFNKGRC